MKKMNNCKGMIDLHLPCLVHDFFFVGFKGTNLFSFFAITFQINLKFAIDL